MSEELVEQGTIISAEDGFLEIELNENDNCDECTAKIFCNSKKDSSKTLKVPNNNNYSTGDKVSISILGKSLIGASLNLYLYPLIMLVMTIFVGSKIFTSNSEIFSFILGIVVVSIYYGILSQLSKKVRGAVPKVIVTKIN